MLENIPPSLVLSNRPAWKITGVYKTKIPSTKQWHAGHAARYNRKPQTLPHTTRHCNLQRDSHARSDFPVAYSP